MKTLAVDIETYSSVDLRSSGVFSYTESDDFEILLFGYSFNNEEVQVVDLAQGEEIPKEIVEALTDPSVIKTAFNASFERTCIAKQLGKEMPPEQWKCSMAHSLTLGLPGNLAGVAETLRLEDKKMDEGKALIRYFSIPCKATKANGGRTRNLPNHDMDKWKLFKDYCKQDVEVERSIRKKIDTFPMTESEIQLWFLDQRINDLGVKVDRKLVENAIECDKLHQEKLYQEAVELTGLENPNSPTQIREWLKETHNTQIDSLAKAKVEELLEEDIHPDARRLLELRQDMSKTSVKKYEAMERSMCKDTRVRGLLQFYGAATGRWCLTGDHEVLTSNGWIRFDEWKGGEIACWSPATEYISFQSSKSLSFDYEGDMYLLESQRISQLSTPDHKMPYWAKDGSWNVATVEELAGKRFSFPYTGRRMMDCNLEHTELRVLIMTQADGHYTKHGNLKFHFTKKRKIERCKYLLRKAGITFILRNHKDATTITIKSRMLPIWLRTFRDKIFGTWLLDESPDIIFDELEFWDGYRCGPNSIQYSTVIKENADMIQALAHLSGRTATIIKKIRNNENWKDAYCVNIWLNPGGKHEFRQKPSKQFHRGKVYCAETNTGFFLVRRNGKVWVTGNSGRLVQVQNLPRNSMKDLDLARNLLLEKNYEALDLLFDSVPDVLSQLIRTAFIPSTDHRFIVSDFSAIEARVIAWLAGEKWRIDVFNSHGKIYEASASQMFGVPIEEITKESELRRKGKISELALGYQGSVGALKAMGAIDMGLTEDELKPLVDTWRRSNPNIVKLWWDIEAAAIKAVKGRMTITMQHNLKLSYRSGILFITLPSGRSLAYVRPRVEIDERFNKDKLTFEGIMPGTRKRGRVDTYGGKLTENIIQAIARDCLAESMIRLDRAGYKTAFHVHDEVVLDVPKDKGSLKEVEAIMGESIAWAEGLPLGAEGFEADYYKKD